MPEAQMPKIGAISWIDLTVADADGLRDFYSDVTGWKSSAVSMGDYSDYCMTPPGSEQPVAGICHARGENAGLPPQWLIYISVADLSESIKRCRERGGSIVLGPKGMGSYGQLAVIRDPAGAVAALVEPKK